ncbi:hypothetical protein DYB26_000051 [Aphanomyces astaci]|uniref:FYVE-type domain-containing protein n=1 Tax=Aphanomyces astaci TaxID=112090 RepID=A0A418F0B3_APHAT|nr:hypothetical protein DYB26_000051 [Aphanomyces astaci]
MFPRVLDPRFLGTQPSAAGKHNADDAKALVPPLQQQARAPRRTDSVSSTASVASWPSVFDEDTNGLTDHDLLQRGYDVAAYVMEQCRVLPANTVDAQSKILTIVNTFIVPGTMNEVLDVYSRDQQLGFQAFLLRVFQDSLTEAMCVRRVTQPLRRPSSREGDDCSSNNYEYYTASNHSSGSGSSGSNSTTTSTIHDFTGCTTSIKAVKLNEKRLFRTSTHDLHLLDFVQKLSDSTFVRVFKSLDAPRPHHKHDSRVTNVLFGFHMDEVHSGGVKVTFYGQHVGKKNSFAYAMLHQLSGSVGLLATAVWRRRLVRLCVARPTPSAATTCHLCSHNLSRRTQTQCRLCDHTVCTHCSQVERAESARCIEVDLRVCNVCLVQCQANLVLTNKAPDAKHPQYLTTDDDEEGGCLPRISEVLGTGQVRHRGHSTAKAHAPPTAAAPLSSSSQPIASKGRVLSGVLGYSTPRGATGHYVAQPGGPSTGPHYDDLDRPMSSTHGTSSSASRPAPRRVLSAHASSTSGDAIPRQRGASGAAITRPALDTIRMSVQAETLRQNAVSNTELTKRLDKLCESLAGALDCHHGYVSLLYKGGFVVKATSGMAQTIRIARTDPLSVATLLKGGAAPLVVPDATVDPRFNTSVRVTGRECVRYYVGLMLVTSDGIELGTVSVSDGLPRARFDATHRRLLHWFASTIVDEIEQCCR